jgi:hypothetical protein
MRLVRATFASTGPGEVPMRTVKSECGWYFLNRATAIIAG